MGKRGLCPPGIGNLMVNTVSYSYTHQVLPMRERSPSICRLNLQSFNAICDVMLLVFEDFSRELCVEVGLSCANEERVDFAC